MKINYEVSVTLDREQLFALIKDSIEKKTGKRLANIMWYYTDNSVISCQLVFCDECVELE